MPEDKLEDLNPTEIQEEIRDEDTIKELLEDLNYGIGGG